MISIIDKKKCSGCKSCMSICLIQCIEMISDKEGFWYPIVNEKLCINCGLCESVCPEINVFHNKDSIEKPKCLAAWILDKEIRVRSSSGGIFTLLANWTLNNNGVVFGAGYNDNFEVVHKVVNTYKDLHDLRGSKYVQSDIGNSYKIAKNYLETGTRVLFSGTPCQIAGLYSFLRKDFEKLITCDLACHGVPSPKVFEAYKNNIKKKYKSDLKAINFRDKRFGWQKYSINVQFLNGENYNRIFYNDEYMRGFLRNYYLRPSCYECTYGKIPRASDITLADFWGISMKYPNLDTKNGISLILVNTSKGERLIEKLENETTLQECSLEFAILGNPCLVKPVKEPILRKSFFIDFESQDFAYIAKKYLAPEPFGIRVVSYIKRILRVFWQN